MFLYGETFAGPRAVGFVFIWVALALYTAEGLWAGRRAVAARQRRQRKPTGNGNAAACWRCHVAGSAPAHGGLITQSPSSAYSASASSYQKPK